MPKFPTDPQTNAVDHPASIERPTQPEPTTITPTNASFDAPASITPASDIGATTQSPRADETMQAFPTNNTPVSPLPVDPSDHTTRHTYQPTVIRRPPVPRPSPAEQQAQDEAAALRSLDDTGIRFAPSPTRLWENEQNRGANRSSSTKRPKTTTIALVGAVAMLSFVAGGIFARLSSQMPLLFPAAQEEQEEPARTDETFPATQTDETEEPSTNGTVWEEPQPTYEPEEPSTPEEPEKGENDDSTLRWDFDEEGNSSVSYDSGTNQVTIDYGDYEVTIDLDDLFGEPGGQAPQEEGDSDRNPWPPYDNGSNDPGNDGYDPYDWSWIIEPQHHWSSYSAA